MNFLIIANFNLNYPPNTLSDDQKIQLLTSVQTIAVVGLSPKPNRPSHQVAKAMQEFSYKIVPVRPAIESVLGEPAYKSIVDIPFTVDLVNVFRASKHVFGIVQQCIECGIPAVWLQEGVRDEQAARVAADAGISIVMDLCIYKEFIRLQLNTTNAD